MEGQYSNPKEDTLGRLLMIKLEDGLYWIRVGSIYCSKKLGPLGVGNEVFGNEGVA